jgi:hypothetical protein
MQQVAEWLEKLGMTEQAHRFVENLLISRFFPKLISTRHAHCEKDCFPIGGCNRPCRP